MTMEAEIKKYNMLHCARMHMFSFSNRNIQFSECHVLKSKVIITSYCFQSNASFFIDICFFHYVCIGIDLIPVQY